VVLLGFVPHPNLRAGGGKGSHRKFAHKNYAGAVTISGKLGEDVKAYQEKQIEIALGQVNA
jgi:hypothetical protein